MFPQKGDIMSAKNILKLKVKELKKLKIIQQILDKQITQQTAALILGLSARQIISILCINIDRKVRGPQGAPEEKRG
jgi:hypothetical protein